MIPTRITAAQFFFMAVLPWDVFFFCNEAGKGRFDRGVGHGFAIPLTERIVKMRRWGAMGRFWRIALSLRLPRGLGVADPIYLFMHLEQSILDVYDFVIVQFVFGCLSFSVSPTVRGPARFLQIWGVWKFFRAAFLSRSHRPGLPSEDDAFM